MKIKTKEQYDAKYRRHAPKKRVRTSDFEGMYAAEFGRDHASGSKPNHKARAVDLDEYYGSIFKAKKSPDFVKIPLEGNWQGCPRSLAYWREDEQDKSGHKVFVVVAMPCVVQHGYEAKVMYGREQLVPAQGKKGEHGDRLGRTW